MSLAEQTMREIKLREQPWRPQAAMAEACRPGDLCRPEFPRET
jgi:hypothetical protein